jgi:hypothetical protein
MLIDRVASNNIAVSSGALCALVSRAHGYMRSDTSYKVVE